MSKINPKMSSHSMITRSRSSSALSRREYTISIIGMGGTGKTTLNLYDYPQKSREQKTGKKGRK